MHFLRCSANFRSLKEKLFQSPFYFKPIKLCITSSRTLQEVRKKSPLMTTPETPRGFRVSMIIRAVNCRRFCLMQRFRFFFRFLVGGSMWSPLLQYSCRRNRREKRRKKPTLSPQKSAMPQPRCLTAAAVGDRVRVIFSCVLTAMLLLIAG